MKTAVLALCLLGAVVAATALNPSSCTSSTTITVGGADSSSCFVGNVAGSSKGHLKFSLTAEQAADPTTKLVIYMWNIDQTSSNAWTFGSAGAAPAKIQTPNWDSTLSSPSTSPNTVAAFDTRIAGVTTGSSPTATTFMLTKTYGATAKCAGNWQVYVDNTNSGDFKWGLLIRLEAVTAPKVMLASGASWSFTDTLLPGGSFSVYVDAPFNKWQYPVQNLGATLSPNGDSAKAPPSGNRVTVWNTALSGTTCNTAIKQVATDLPNIPVTAAYCGAPGTANNARYTVTAPTFGTSDFSSGYNWATNGPFLNGAFKVTTVTDFPSLSSAQSAVIKLKNKDSDDNLITTDNQYVYMLEVPQNWWRIQTSTTQTDTSSSDAVVNSPVLLKWAWSTAVTANPIASGGSSFGNTYDRANDGVFNSQFYSPGTAGQTGTVNSKYLSPGTVQGKKFIMFFVGTTSCETTNTLSFNIAAASVSPLKGECQSYTDCYTEPSDATKTRADNSANSDASRMTHCMVVNSITDFVATPVTQCVECTSDCECNEGQYCYNNDDGVCTVGGRSWICDSWANARRGLCVKKSTSVLGSRCRTDQASAIATGSQWYTTTSPSNSILVKAESAVTVGGDDDFSGNSDITGYGFCGEVRYWNATAGANPGYTLGTGEMVRSVSWKGRCFNKVCQECRASSSAGTVTGYSNCNNDRRCINGKILDNMFVDFTQRTYTKNTLAGTILGAVFMIILLQLCTVAHIFVTMKK